MKSVYKPSALFGLLLLCLSSTPLQAEESKLGSKVGILDIQSLMTQSPQAEKASQRLEKEFKSRRDDMLDKQKNLEKKLDAFQKDKDIMAEAERIKMERELNKLQQDLRNLQEELQADYALRYREEMEKFIETVKSVVKSYAEQDHFDLILVVPQESTLFMSSKTNVTEAVLSKLKTLK